MKYVQYINSLIKEEVKNQSNIVLYGQNIDAGSSLSGLTRGLSITDGLIINTQNSENLLVGAGFGLMLNNVSSVFFMKQMDFLLLGIDHLVNTYNILRQSRPDSSFTIFPITVDSGYEGPQSALNNLDDFCSVAGIDGYSFTTKQDAKAIISQHLISPGFRILTTGQRLLRDDVLDLEVVYKDIESSFFQYEEGSDASIICFNQSLQYGLDILKVMSDKGYKPSLFSINSHLKKKYNFILENIKRTKRLIIIDDSKSRNRLSDYFLSEVLIKCDLKRYKILSRQPQKDDFFPRKDTLDFDCIEIINEIFK